MAKVKIEDFARDLELDILYDGDSKVIDIVSSSVNRPGLQLAGFFDYFAAVITSYSIHYTKLYEIKNHLFYSIQ